MRYTVDRIEGDIAVCEDDNRKMTEIPIKELPEGVKEGMCLAFVEGKGWAVMEEADRSTRIRNKMDSLWS